MADKPKEHGLRVRCQNPKCGARTVINWGAWKAQITGALKIWCPECRTVSTFVGVFGQPVQLERVKDDLRRANQVKIVDALGEDIRPGAPTSAQDARKLMGGS